MATEKLLTRIAGLLRQAEGTDNPHEAEAFMAAAQRLATQASIDLAVARAHNRSAPNSGPVHRVVPIGEPGKRGLRTFVVLFAAIAHANDVRCDVAHNSTSVHAFGFESDVDTVQALYSSIVVQMVRASDLYLTSPTHKASGVHGVTARLNFQLAYGSRIGQRLKSEKAAAQAEIIEHSEPGTALALRNKEVELTDYYRSESKARGSWRGNQMSYAPEAQRAGDRAARNARLGGNDELPNARTRLTS